MNEQTFTGLMLPPEALLADDNLRYSLKQSRIDSLADDILAQGGVLQNLVIEPLTEPVGECTYRVTAGHYRRAAVLKLNKEQGAGLLLPCVINTTVDAAARLKQQLSENGQRENLTPMDTAIAIRKLMDAGVPKQEIRNIFSRPGGKKGMKVQPASNSFINMMLSFLDFPKPIQKDIHDGIIGVAGAYTLTKKPREKWDDIVASIKADRDAEIAQEEKDEEKYLAQEAKEAESRKKEEDAKKALEAAKADLDLKNKQADEFIHVEVEAHQQAKAKGLEAEARKAAEAAFKAAEEKTKAAVKLVEDAKKAVEKLEGKVQTAAQHAEERRKKLEDARKLAAKEAKEKKPASKAAGPKEVEKAAGKTGSPAGTVALTATEMRKAVNDWALPGSFPKIQAIFNIVKDCFAGGCTPAQAYTKMGKVTGEKLDKRAGNVQTEK